MKCCKRRRRRHHSPGLFCFRVLAVRACSARTVAPFPGLISRLRVRPIEWAYQPPYQPTQVGHISEFLLPPLCGAVTPLVSQCGVCQPVGLFAASIKASAGPAASCAWESCPIQSCTAACTAGIRLGAGVSGYCCVGMVAILVHGADGGPWQLIEQQRLWQQQFVAVRTARQAGFCCRF